MRTLMSVFFLLIAVLGFAQAYEGTSSYVVKVAEENYEAGRGQRNLDPDLTGSYTSASSQSLSPGDQLTVYYSVSNIGSEPAGSSDTKFYFSNDQIFGDGDDVYFGMQACGPLAVDATSNLIVDLLVPGYISQGSWYLYLKVDANDNVGESNENNNVVMAGSMFTITQDTSQITILSPNGGETWMHGSSNNIQWTYSELTGNVKIDLIQGTSSATVLVISPSSAIAAGSFTWVVPSTLAPASNYKVRITSLQDLSVYDTSNNYFTISPVPSIALISPNGGETWQIGNSYSVSWSYLNLTGNVRLDLLQGTSSTPVHVISSSTPVNSGIFSWLIPNAIAQDDNYKVRITSLSNGSVYDSSNNYFAIQLAPSLQLLSPNGGEIWLKNSVHIISWESTNVTGNLKIELMQGTSSTPVLVISPSTAVNAGSFSWTIPNTVNTATNYKVKITSLSTQSINDQSDAYFRIDPAPSVSVLNPNGGETWLQGSSYNINWTFTSLSGSVRIDLMQGTDSTPLATIATSTPISTGAYTWLIPFAVDPGSNYKIKISSLADPSVFDSSDGYFTINPAPSLSLISPDGGETWTMGNTYPISWTYLSMGGSIRIELLQGTGTTPLLTISASTQVNAGSFSWTIPTTLDMAPNYRIKITSNDDAMLTDTSDYFSIIPVPSITILGPNGGETWLLGHAYNIAWSYASLTGNVKIELMQNGATVSIIAESQNIEATLFNWMIPTDLPISDNYRIRISSLTEPTVFDLSDASFAISFPAITVTSPNGLELWMSGEYYDILWESQNLSGNVKIELFRATNTTPQLVVHSSIPAATGTYHWLVPNLPTGNDYLIKISSLSEASVFDHSDNYFSIEGVANEDPTLVPMVSSLISTYPNPFHQGTTIHYGLSKATETAIRVYNLKGRLIKTLYAGKQSSGWYDIHWDGTDNNGCHVSSGIYMVLMKSDNANHRCRITLIK